MKIIKKLTAAMFCGILIAGGMFISRGYGEDTLRIGLERYYMDAASVTANNQSLTIAGDETLKLESSTGFKFEPAAGSFDSYKKCASFEEALEYGNAVYSEGSWGSLGQPCDVHNESAKEETTEETTEQAEDTKEETKETEPSADSNAFTLKGAAIKVTYSGGSFIFDTNGKLVLSSPNNVVDLGTMAYRGKIELTNAGGTIDTVNIISMDEYLYGVVPAEVYAEWPAEALKAQAVAARSYAKYHIGKHSGYDLCDHTHCQQYSGYNIESSSTNNAVDATSGVMAYYGGAPANTVYYDCDGGHTLSAAEVWGSDIPYLQSVPDPYEQGARSWEKSFTLDELTQKAKSAGLNVGSVTSVSITKQRNNKLAEEITITGTQGSATVTGSDIKEFFAKDGEKLWSRCITISGASAPANNVYVTGAAGTAENLTATTISAVNGDGTVTVLDDINLVIRGSEGDIVISPGGGKVTEAKDTVLVSGAGWGHGVGMSQCGANGMALQGFDYKEILKYYYKGIEVK